MCYFNSHKEAQKTQQATIKKPNIKELPYLYRIAYLSLFVNNAPEVGIEPTTNRLTGDRSTAELLRNVFTYYQKNSKKPTLKISFYPLFSILYRGYNYIIKSNPASCTVKYV